MSDAEMAAVESLIRAWEGTLKKNGIDPSDRTVIDEAAFNRFSQAARDAETAGEYADALDQLIDIQISKQTTAEALKLARRYMSTKARIGLLERVRGLAETYKGKTEEAARKAKGKALKDIVSRSVGSKVDITLEELIQATHRDSFNLGLLPRLDKVLGGPNRYAELRDPELSQDVVREAMALMAGRTDRATRSDKAFDVAKVLVEELDFLRFKNNRAGDHMQPKRGMIQPLHDWTSIRDNRDAFVTTLAESLDESVHGDIGRRRALAEKMYRDIEMNHGIIDVNAMGDTTPRTDFGDPLLSEALKDGRGIDPVLVFKDGDSWINYNNRFGQRDFMATILSQFEYMSRRNALMTMFGPNWQTTWNELVKFASSTDGTRNANSTLRNQPDLKQAEYQFRRLALPTIPQRPAWTAAMQTGRNVEIASKLGSATLAALLDVPTVMAFGSRIQDMPVMQNMGRILSGYGSGSSEARTYGRYLGTAVEAMNGSIVDRFMAGADTAVGKLSNGSSRMAHFVMKVSGLEWWTDSLRAGVTAMMRSDLGDKIAQRIAWSELTPKYRDTLSRTGIGEADWTRLLREQPLDAEGKFDPLVLREADTLDPNAEPGVTLTHRLLAWFDEGATSMVIGPDARDVAATGLYFEPGSASEQVARTLLGFKTFPITYTRKVLGRTVHQRTTVADKVNTIATLTALTVLSQWVVMNAREVSKGNQLLDPAQAGNWLEAFTSSGVFGLIGDFYADTGGKNFFRMLFNGEMPERVDASRLFLGPFFTDVMSIMDSGARTAGAGGRLLLEEAGLVDRSQEDIEGALRGGTRDLFRTMSGTVPGQSLWFARGLYRSAIYDTMFDFVDPEAYDRAQQRAERLAEDKNLNGELRGPYGRWLDRAFGR
ncbi:hypothetical protein [Pacificispira sp.]|uniref:hypothetical protein n=1 Tax=Pacificispira sp. TaxID=2888761 RepID=UPI003BABD928